MVTFRGAQFPAITFRRLKGGVRDANDIYTFEDLVYTVEASTDVQTWSTSPTVPILQTSVVDSADSPATVEVVTYRYGVPLTDPSPGDRAYLRLRVTRLPEDP